MTSKWSLDDDKALLLHVHAGKSRAAICVALDRTPDAVSARLTFMRANGVDVPPLQRGAHGNSAARLRELQRFYESLKGQQP